MKKESQGKYVFVVVPGHPMADSRGRVLEHRYKMAEHLGRKLLRSEIVHHGDGNPKNNTLSNLKLIKWGEHTRYHTKKYPQLVVKKICPVCGIVFTREARRLKKGKKSFCSISCASSYFVPKRPKKKREHGNYNTYRAGCRCAKCRKAIAERVRKWRHGQRA